MTRSLELTTAAATLPVDLNLAKAQLKLDDELTADDALILGLVRASVEACERFTGRQLITATYTLFLDAWPVGSTLARQWWDGVREGADLPRAADAVELPRPPLQSVTTITTYDDADTGTLWAASNYIVDTPTEAPGRVAKRVGASWPIPTRAAKGIEIVFKAGYGDAAGDVPEALRQGLLLLAAHLYENREPVVDGVAVAKVPLTVEALWGPHRVVRL